MTTATVASLRHVRLFAGLDEEACDSVARLMRVRCHRPGQHIIAFEDDSQDVHFLLSGRVRVTNYSRSGREIAFRDLEAGELFGELAAIDRLPRSANVIALTEAVVGSIGPAAFMDLLHRHPSVMEALLEKLVFLVRALSERIADFAKPVPARVCIELERLGRPHADAHGRARIAPAPLHADIANRISSHREAVTRTLTELEHEGIVRRRPRELLILDLGRLAERARQYEAE
jgi:CRP-like cAMP-binding protein